MDDKPTIEFPCEDYPIKVIGMSGDDLQRSVVEIARSHDFAFSEETVSLQVSSKGKYLSVRFSIRATGKAQLQALHQDLLAHPSVKLVL
jgi:putative lipoic acid-binding regulatory protein